MVSGDLARTSRFRGLDEDSSHLQGTGEENLEISVEDFEDPGSVKIRHHFAPEDLEDSIL